MSELIKIANYVMISKNDYSTRNFYFTNIQEK